MLCNKQRHHHTYCTEECVEINNFRGVIRTKLVLFKEPQEAIRKAVEIIFGDHHTQTLMNCMFIILTTIQTKVNC